MVPSWYMKQKSIQRLRPHTEVFSAKYLHTTILRLCCHYHCVSRWSGLRPQCSQNTSVLLNKTCMYYTYYKHSTVSGEPTTWSKPASISDSAAHNTLYVLLHCQAQYIPHSGMSPDTTVPTKICEHHGICTLVHRGLPLLTRMLVGAAGSYLHNKAISSTHCTYLVGHFHFLVGPPGCRMRRGCK